MSIDTTTIKGKVEHCLETYPEARNSDKSLIPLVWWTFHSDRLIDGPDGKPAVMLRHILELPSTESIRRCRQKFQEGPCVKCEGRLVVREHTHASDCGLDDPPDDCSRSCPEINDVPCRTCFGTGLGGKYPPTDRITFFRRMNADKVRDTINTENFDEHLPA